MDKDDYASDSDQSDEDFRPENIESEEHSEEGSDDNNAESGEEEKASLKDIAKKTKRSSRRKRKPDNQEKDVEEKDGQVSKLVSEETEKKRSDALWAEFLGDVSGSSKESRSSRSCNTINSCNVINTSKGISSEAAPQTEKKIITEVFDFAGEEVKVIKEVPINNEDIKKESAQSKHIKREFGQTVKTAPAKRMAGGLGSVLNVISKKNKISVLEKSKLDWDTFKKSEGLSEELKTHNKGREGYLDKQDFLQRTDFRQFEIEKNLRQSKRSNR